MKTTHKITIGCAVVLSLATLVPAYAGPPARRAFRGNCHAYTGSQFPNSRATPYNRQLNYTSPAGLFQGLRIDPSKGIPINSPRINGLRGTHVLSVPNRRNQGVDHTAAVQFMPGGKVIVRQHFDTARYQNRYQFQRQFNSLQQFQNQEWPINSGRRPFVNRNLLIHSPGSAGHRH